MPVGVYVRTEQHKQMLRNSRTSSNYMKKCTGNKNHNWKDTPKYQAIHYWLNTNFGRANHCENRDNHILDFDCRNNSDRFVWALIEGEEYKRDKKLYAQLCQSCNIRLDIKDSKQFKERCSKASLKRWRLYENRHI